MMSDAESLAMIKSTLSDFLAFTPNQTMFAVDINANIVYCSPSFTQVKLSELCSLESMILQEGIKMDVSKVELAIHGVVQDKLKRRICCPVIINCVQNLVDFYLVPIINPASKNIIGVLVYLIRFELTSRQDIVLSSKNTQSSTLSAINVNYPFKTLSVNAQPKCETYIKLTSREENIVFLLIFNYSSREIAEILSELETKSISKDSVDKLIANQLQVKFKVVHRYKLVERLIELGYHKVVPKDFASKFLKISRFLE